MKWNIYSATFQHISTSIWQQKNYFSEKKWQMLCIRISNSAIDKVLIATAFRQMTERKIPERVSRQRSRWTNRLPSNITDCPNLTWDNSPPLSPTRCHTTQQLQAGREIFKHVYLVCLFCGVLCYQFCVENGITDLKISIIIQNG